MICEPQPIEVIHATSLIKARAYELGFDSVGIARADVPLDIEFERYQQALANELHGPLSYLAKHVQVRQRIDTDAILLGAKSIIVIGIRYDRPNDENDPELAQFIARYARGRDYHQHVRRRLRKLANFVCALGENIYARPLIDTAPVLERAWAARAGLGFVGKNGMLITPGLGSFFLIGEVVTTLALDVNTPIEERCGKCTLCIDACPTNALVRPFVLDARRCIATMTIEWRGLVPNEVREATSQHLFGCDICQEVCPYNAKKKPLSALHEDFTPHARWFHWTLEDLAQLGMPNGPDFDEITLGSPLRRAGIEGLARSACMMLGRLQRTSAFPMLHTLCEHHPSEVVRDAASWALKQNKKST